MFAHAKLMLESTCFSRASNCSTSGTSGANGIAATKSYAGGSCNSTEANARANGVTTACFSRAASSITATSKLAFVFLILQYRHWQHSNNY